ncbi:MAG TPA: GNAT family N-acetyltransferase [candidate division Zixibacteria bacterium]|nr:GNAT family N-acetyltransferase [candidate division Zixibacteria bacterium]
MIYELPKKNFQIVLDLFDKHKNHPVINGVIEGNNPGKIWVDDLKKPKKSLLWAQSEEDFFLAGDSTDENFNLELNKLIKTSIKNQATKKGEDSFSLILCSESWEKQIAVIFEEIDYIISYSESFELNCEKFNLISDWRNRIPSEFELKPVDKKSFKSIADEGGRLFSKWWYSFNDFKEKGVGYILVEHDKIISTCFACFAGANAVEIGIVTHPEYLRKGFAFITAAAFIEECLERNIDPIWHTSKINIPSQNLALKLGYEKKGEIKSFYFKYDLFDNLYAKAYHILYTEKDFRKAITNFQKALDVGKPKRFFNFHYACALALLGERDEAFNRLFLFVSTISPEILEHIDFISNNENLKSLHDDVRWEEFIVTLHKIKK